MDGRIYSRTWRSAHTPAEAVQGGSRNIASPYAQSFSRILNNHGTSIAVCLFAIDKLPGGTMPSTISRTNLADFLDCVVFTLALNQQSRPRRPLPSEARAFPPSRAVKSTRPAPRTRHAPVKNEILPVEYEALQIPAPLLDQVGIYLPYRPRGGV